MQAEMDVIPERPMRSPQVVLVGEMQGTGFNETQWLVQRNGKFLQVSEVPFRILEHANGERTDAEIAARLTESTDWQVTADQVAQIIRSKLVPFGLVTSDNESVVQAVQAQPRSAVGLNLRKRLLGPAFIDPIAGVLQWLFAPPVMVPLLLAIVVAHGWLYFVHGLGDSLRAALITPGALVAIFALLYTAAFFHELGHAAALKYGGGRVRGMGTGVYLFYPVFYTDVTDSYRLSRWARVRTDLGGFYFHLIFALGLIGYSFASGNESLLVLVLLINLDILRQCLPFVRFDGYWALADLTGIPDFFSQMGPFLLSLLPGETAAGSRLPTLRPWVKAVFVIYILATIPMLSILYLLMVKGLPMFVYATWEAVVRMATIIAEAWGQASVDLILIACFQMVLIGIPVLGTAYLLYRGGRALSRAIWKWSVPTLRRRLVGALVTACLAALIASFWAPQLQQFSTRQQAMAVAARAGHAIPGVRSFEVTQREHVEASVVYEHTPPVGGNHAPVWQNCGFYGTPIASESAVHSMEHGAVWITYRPDLPEAQVTALRDLAREDHNVLVSPYPDLPTPIVASAWGNQLWLEEAHDPRLFEFTSFFASGRQAPEPNGPCTGGTGAPE
jgi:putative peptide zinc metalloprotease protein